MLTPIHPRLYKGFGATTPKTPTRNAVMIVLGIYGSPRKGGNSDQLLDRALKGVAASGAEVKKIYARHIKISGCLECGGCDQTGICVQKDDMSQIYPLLEESNVIILATPIFFYSPPAQIKAIIDRAQACWAKRFLTKPPEARKRHDSGIGYLISIGATKGKKLFDCTKLVAKYFFDALDMAYGGDLLIRGVEKKSDILKRSDALDAAYELGKKAARAEQVGSTLL